MLSLYETIRMSVTVLNVNILQNSQTLWCNDILRSLVTTTISER